MTKMKDWIRRTAFDRLALSFDAGKFHVPGSQDPRHTIHECLKSVRCNTSTLLQTHCLASEDANIGAFCPLESVKKEKLNLFPAPQGTASSRRAEGIWGDRSS
jgi:hypothetical protein